MQKRIAPWSAIVFISCLATGCGGVAREAADPVESTQDRLVKEFGDKLLELGTLYDSIVDVSTAKAAVPRLQQLTDELRAVKTKLDQLPEVSEEEYQQTLDAMMARVESSRQSTMNLAARMQADQAMVPILAPVLEGMQKAMQQQQPDRPVN